MKRKRLLIPQSCFATPHVDSVSHNSVRRIRRRVPHCSRMGVQGLTSYVEKNRHLQPLKVRNTTLIIDGCSLYYMLYFTSGLDQEHGGDYDSFALLVRQFFEALFTCKIRPFVVLDGGTDPSDKKFRTLKERLQSKIKQANALSRGANGSILPLLSKEVFVQVLRSLHVPLIQSIFEADSEIAALANEWNCAVLTNDSDFYIYDLKAGCLPITHFQWGNVTNCKRTSEWFIPARVFTINRFCANFNQMNKALLPLFAVIIGNDYSHLQDTERLFSCIEVPKAGRAPGSRMHSRIDSLLNWLAGFPGPQEAVEALLELLGDRCGRNVQVDLSCGIQDYQLSPSRLAPLFASKCAPTFGHPEPLDALPEWILCALSEAQLSPIVADVLALERVLLPVQVENCRLPSSNIASQPIRQVLYGLLLDWKQRQGQKQATCGRGQGKGPSPSGAPHCVEEFDRHELQLRRSLVQATLPSLLRQLPLERLNKMSHPVRQQLLLQTLGVDESVIHAVPPSLSLPLCVTCYWVSSCNPRPSKPHVQALLLSLVYGESCRLRAAHTGSAAGSPALKTVCERLDWLRSFRGATSGAVDLDTAHVYSQWQSCLWSSFYLNKLLCSPLPEPECAGLYSGTLVHRIVRELKGGATVEALLVGAAFPQQLYSNLLEALWRSVGTTLFSTPSSSSKKKRRGKKQPPQQQPGNRRGGRATDIGPPIQSISNRFALLEVDDRENDP
ncbi:protein asteroid1-like [Arapaima gigas]